MAEVEFIFNGRKTIIQCQLNESMKNICNKFKEKTKIDNANLFYSYDGRIGINEGLSFEQFANSEDKKRNKMNIIVYEDESDESETNGKNIIKSKNIICPECKENIILEIKGYKINLYGCKYKHKFENILLNEFEEKQNINLNNIICDLCKKSNKCISYDNIFYRCLTCKTNICPLCKTNHNNNHQIINYDDKYYICEKHCENYIFYCETCKMNACTLCDGHKNHKRILYSDIYPKKERLTKKLNQFKLIIHSFNTEIKMLINILNDVMKNINIYYNINEDIIKYYNNKYKNYETLYYLNQFPNLDIISDINNTINSNTIQDKFNIIYNMYKKMNVDEINICYKIKDEKIRIFGEEFVKKNKNYCSLIINGKEKELTDIYYCELNNSEKEVLELKLKGITNITDMSYMFSDCSSLLSLSDTNKLFNNLKITSMMAMFINCSSLKSISGIAEWNTSHVTNMKYMFFNCSSLLSLSGISKWNISNVINMGYMFYNCSSIITLPDISKWNTSNVNNMCGLFCNCSSLLSLPDISKWNTSNVNNMSYLFCNCSSLLSLPDISKWNISNVNNISYIFFNCPSLSYIPDISEWNTSNIEDISYSFCECSSLISLPNITKWNISNVNDISGLFRSCTSILVLPDISKWVNSNELNMIGIFDGCPLLKSLPDISKFNDYNDDEQNIIAKEIKFEFGETCMTTVHPHIMKYSKSSRWCCNGRKLYQGCYFTDLSDYAFENKSRFRCKQCDFDLCDKCIIHYISKI